WGGVVRAAACDRIQLVLPYAHSLLRALCADPGIGQLTLAASSARFQNRFPARENLLGRGLDCWRCDPQPDERRTIARSVLSCRRSVYPPGRVLTRPAAHAAEKGWPKR